MLRGKKKFMRFSHHSTSTSNKINSHFFSTLCFIDCLFIYVKQMQKKNMLYTASVANGIPCIPILSIVWSILCVGRHSMFCVSKRLTSACDWECILSSHWAFSLLHPPSQHESIFSFTHICATYILNTHFIELLSCSFYFHLNILTLMKWIPLYTAISSSSAHSFTKLHVRVVHENTISNLRWFLFSSFTIEWGREKKYITEIAEKKSRR